MNRVLIVKVTSLGDIIQAQPLVADLHRAFPGIKVDWAADSAFAEVLQWNRGIDRVLAAPLRRFKARRGGADLGAIAASIAELRRVRYDAVLDVHGVYKSAIIAFLARARHRYGYQSRDLGERGAAFAYSKRFSRGRGLNAWEGLRATVADALGYAIEGAPRFGLTVPDPVGPLAALSAGPMAMLFHATSCDEKKWPIRDWHEIGRHLLELGLRAVLPWGTEGEYAEAVAIAAGIPGALVLPRLTVQEIAQHIAAASLVVGTDTGFVHLASALGKPTVMVFTATSRDHFGVSLPGYAISIGDEGMPPPADAVREAIDEVWSAAASRDPARTADATVGCARVAAPPPAAPEDPLYVADILPAR
jgi:heptosyltransferase-1